MLCSFPDDFGSPGRDAFNSSPHFETNPFQIFPPPSTAQQVCVFEVETQWWQCLLFGQRRTLTLCNQPKTGVASSVTNSSLRFLDQILSKNFPSLFCTYRRRFPLGPFASSRLYHSSIWIPTVVSITQL